MNLPQQVTIVEVGARDGLQNEPVIVDSVDKIALINRLSASGLSLIEVGSFVSPQLVPQMADTADILAGVERRPGISYPVLVPNQKGLEAALSAGAEEVAIFCAASETFSQRNLNCSIKQSFERFAKLTEMALSQGVKVRGYISCVAGCPYEGGVATKVVADLAAQLVALGCYEVSLGDTIGIATPGQVQTLLEMVTEYVPKQQLAVHFHDTYGQALANIIVALDTGITTIDSSVAGLGGCPFAPGASGNVATEDVLYMLNGLGIETGVNLDSLIAAGNFISDILARPTRSRVAQALAGRCID
jgi:hydroxymethylglutaryl-CoA lyase